MPTVYQWRFHRKKVKLFLNTNNSASLAFLLKGMAKGAKMMVENKEDKSKDKEDKTKT